jgi:hypothetical protein
MQCRPERLVKFFGGFIGMLLDCGGGAAFLRYFGHAAYCAVGSVFI